MNIVYIEVMFFYLDTLDIRDFEDRMDFITQIEDELLGCEMPNDERNEAWGFYVDSLDIRYFED